MTSVKRTRLSPSAEEDSSTTPQPVTNRQEARRIRSREAAQKRRDNLSQLLKELCDLLPYADSVKESFDKSTVLRLVVSYLRAKDHFGDNFPSQGALPSTAEASSSLVSSSQKSVGENDFSELFLPALNGFLLVCDLRGIIVYVSDNVHHHLGLFQHDLVGTSVYNIIHKDDHKDLQDACMTPLSSLGDQDDLKYSIFCRMKCTAGKMPAGGCKNPGYKVIHCSGRITTGKSFQCGPCLVSTLCPVTPTPIVEVQLRPGVFTMYNSMHLKLLKVHMNDTMQSLMGYDSTALIGRSLFEFHHVGDMPMCHKCYLDLIAKGEGVSGYYRFLRGNGKWVWLQSRAAIMYNSRTARAEYIVVTNYVINQDEALEQVASEGRCTDMSPGLYIPPDVPYPKHPPLDNPSVRAKQAAIEMLSKPEGSASSASDASDTVTEIVTDTEPSVTDTEPPTPSSDVSPYTHYIQNPPSVSSQFGPIIKPPTISPIADYVSEPDQCVPASIADPVTPDMIDGVRLPLHSRAPDVHHQGQSSMPTDVDLGYLGDYEMPSINPTSGSTVQKCPDQGVKSHVLPSGLVQPASVPYPGNMASHEYSQYVQYAPPAMDSSQRHPPQNQFDPSSMMDMNMPSNQFMPGDVSLNQVIQPSLDASQLQQSILLHAQNTDNTMYNMTGGYPMTPCHNSKKPYDQGVHQQQQSSTFQQQANKLHHQSEYSQQHSAPTQFSRKPVMVVNPIRHEISSSTPSTGLINNEPVNQNQSQNFTQQPNKPIYSQSCLYPNSLPVQAGMLPQPPPQELPNGQEQSNDVSELDIQQLESLFNSEDLQDLEELISSEMMGLGSMPLQPDSVTATAGGPGYPGAGLSSW